jgi:pimeloyl-ACP methyl ester carboxylesterase
LVRDAAPTDGALTHAWNAYKPFRDYLKAQNIDKNTIAAASVITTMKPQDRIPKVRQAVRARPLPVTTGIQVDQSGQAYDLTTGTVTIPQFQSGTRPFKTPADGGAIMYDGQGLPVFVADQNVKFAMTVPKGAAPAGGWPIVIYAHGTGGNERSFIDKGVADEMAGVGVAVIGIEQVQHGDRRGLPASEADLEANAPERLFYNFLNPRAARDNVVQTAADHFQVVRLVVSFKDITGQAVALDATRVFFFGHSQGSQGGFLFAAHEPLVKLAILSGAGGYLIESFVGKTKPVNVAAAIELALADFEVDRFHPLLNIVQAAFEEVDPSNYAGTMFMDDWTASGYPHRSVFMSYGIGDTYTPEKTMLALARAMRVKQWPVSGYELDGVEPIPSLPHTQTWGFGGGVYVTAAVVEYQPAGDKDGHFVIFDNADARKQVTEYVRTMVQTGVPTLVSP